MITFLVATISKCRTSRRRPSPLGSEACAFPGCLACPCPAAASLAAPVSPWAPPRCCRPPTGLQSAAPEPGEDLLHRRGPGSSNRRLRPAHPAPIRSPEPTGPLQRLRLPSAPSSPSRVQIGGGSPFVPALNLPQFGDLRFCINRNKTFIPPPPRSLRNAEPPTECSYFHGHVGIYPNSKQPASLERDTAGRALGLASTRGRSRHLSEVPYSHAVLRNRDRLLEPTTPSGSPGRGLNIPLENMHEITAPAAPRDTQAAFGEAGPLRR